MPNRSHLRISFIAIALTLVAMGWSQAASITGTVKFEGEPPTMKEIDMSSDPGCKCEAGHTPRAEALVLGDGQTMANVFAEIVSGLPEKEWPVPTEPVVLTQKGCAYSPHVFAIQVGQPLDILNPDEILHNVHSFARVNDPFNLAMPKFKNKMTKTFDKVEAMFPFKCDIHSWMLAYCVVLDHPFHDVTGTDGIFKIDGLDAGTYEIEVTHEKLGPQKASVTVTADETKTIDFVFSRTKK